MILDSLENLEMYATLNPNFPKAIEFIKNTNLAALPTGRNEVCGDLVFANVVEVKPKTKEAAQIEIHRKYIDLQIPLSGDEVMGYTPINELPYAEFIEADDASLYPANLDARDYFNVKQGEFVMFFPQDGHAPAITPEPLRKVIVKIAIE